MKKLLLILLTMPFIGFTQVSQYECNCEENSFRQTFEIDTVNQTIRRISSLNLLDGEVHDGMIHPFNNVIWKNDFIYFLRTNDITGFYRFNLTNNTFVLESYYGDIDQELNKEKTQVQNYNCFWYK